VVEEVVVVTNSVVMNVSSVGESVTQTRGSNSDPERGLEQAAASENSDAENSTLLAMPKIQYIPDLQERRIVKVAALPPNLAIIWPDLDLDSYHKGTGPGQLFGEVQV